MLLFCISFGLLWVSASTIGVLLALRRRAAAKAAGLPVPEEDDVWLQGMGTPAQAKGGDSPTLLASTVSRAAEDWASPCRPPTPFGICVRLHPSLYFSPIH